MIFKFEGLELLLKIMDGDSFNEKLFQDFINCEHFKDFIEHEKVLNRKTSEESIRENIKLVISGDDGDESYGFNYIRKYKSQINDKIALLKNDSKEIEQAICARVGKYAPLDLYDNKFIMHIYGGGHDYGFSEKDGECYINLALLADEIEYLEDIMVHEYYHTRRRDLETQPYDFSKENYLKTLMYHIMEEGIATLVEFEYEKKYDGFSFMSKDRFDKKSEYFKNLDNCIRECHLNNNYSKEIVLAYFQDSIPNYIIGYWIGQVLFKEAGKSGLELWNRNCDYIGSFKSYINILRRDKINSGLSKDVEDYLLGL